MDAQSLIRDIHEARARTLELVGDLTDEQWMVPLRETLNPFGWELAHVAYFWERFVLRDLDDVPSLHMDSDSLFDSSTVEHDSRWGKPLPPRLELHQYMQGVHECILKRLEAGTPDANAVYRNLLSLYHEDMHAEAFTYMRQTVGYPPPPVVAARHGDDAGGGPLRGDAEIPGGVHMLGADPDSPHFVFDNEQWQHAVELAPYRIARAPVTQAEYLEFVRHGGYRNPQLWSEAGREWLTSSGQQHPVYWREADGGWQRRHFDRWVELEPHRPVVHVCWFEADAFCNWAGRRLPTEAEWEHAAAPDKRRHPWGDAPGPRANLDWAAMDTVDVGAYADGDSPFGCRQMLGNVWEWTASDFGPFPGFEPGPYRDYSAPWFGSRKVLRGGSWATRARLIHTGWRNFFQPWRNDIPAGFRTCNK
jgi:gamma-glutamyl hercynylcysteine S-oxide synthase